MTLTIWCLATCPYCQSKDQYPVDIDGEIEASVTEKREPLPIRITTCTDCHNRFMVGVEMRIKAVVQDITESTEIGN